MWWPGLDLDVEKKVKGCSTCQASHLSPPPAPPYPCKWLTQPVADPEKQYRVGQASRGVWGDAPPGKC